MLTTLTKLGEQLSEDHNEWADVIDIPKVDPQKENLIARLIFNLDEQRIDVEISGEFMEKSPFLYKCISIKGGNNKATYSCCRLDKIVQIEKTFFGKIDNKGKFPQQGEFKEFIDNNYPVLKASDLYKIFVPLFQLRSKFLEGKWDDAETVNKKLLGADYKKSGNRKKIVFIYACLISKEFGFEQAKPISDINGFDNFIRLDRFTKPTSEEQKISYATGLSKQNVIGVEFPNRYSLNYMFVETTLNYASQFDKNNFSKNYQINVDEQLFLERASEHLLNTQQVTIANISHCIIPQFLDVDKNSIDIKTVLKKVFKKSNLLFQSNQYQGLITGIEDKIQENETYWINFLAFESDGNSFKTINLIKNVSKTHLEQVTNAFIDVDLEFKELEYAVNWQGVMTDFNDKKEKAVYRFNLNTVYRIIPQRKDKEKKNEALSIFKAILENRQIEKQILFKHFVDLVLCHRFGRYDAFKNVKRFGEDFFDLAIRDCVFKYWAFLKVLKQLNFIKDMENKNENQDVEEVISLEETTSLNDYQQRIDTFFSKMNFKDYQKALFYLGRMLSSVAYIQKDKKKTVLDKLNFNGMDKNDLQRLRNALIEKARQYGEVDKVIFNDARFNEYFDYNAWSINPHEALFFILTGYSFGIKAKEAK